MPTPIPLLIHIGYHKTGTTWLQQVIFRDADCGYFRPVSRDDLIDAFVLPGPFAFDADATREHFLPGIEQTRERGSIPVLTAERLSGNPHSGGYDSALIADRLRATFPDAHILLMVREQESMILSSYSQYVRAGGPQSLKRYLTLPRMGKARFPRFNWEYLDYDRLVTHYQSLFGAANVLVYAFEQLRQDPVALARTIIERTGGRFLEHLPTKGRNTGMCGATLAIKRQVNRFAVYDSNNPGGLLDSVRLSRAMVHGFETLDRAVPGVLRKRSTARLRRHIHAEVGDRFCESNARLHALTGLPLRDLGYAISTDTPQPTATR